MAEEPINTGALRGEAKAVADIQAGVAGATRQADGSFLSDRVVITPDPAENATNPAGSIFGPEEYNLLKSEENLAPNFQGVGTGSQVPGGRAISGAPQQFGPNFSGVGTGSQVPGGRAVGGPQFGPDFTGVGTGSQVPGGRAITGAPQQIGPDFTGVGTGSQVPGNDAILGSDQIGPNFGTPTGTGPDNSIGAVDGTGTRTIPAVEVSAPKLTNDWRFKIGLLPGSDVLYKDGTQGSLIEPLLKTDGVIFPYTPNVLVNYRANYDKVSPTHSNYPSYFYQGSEISDVQVNGTFTAQSLDEADYMMAMIHFFKSASKMFYGQDKNKGTPPPLLSITGFGPDQFNMHKCVLSQFNYSLPDNVDYIRTSFGANSIKAQSTRAKLQGGGGKFGIVGTAARIGRLFGIGTEIGAEKDFQTANEGTELAGVGASYVPTKIELSLILLPVVTREEQSRHFSLKDYASGEGLSQRGQW